MPSGIIGTGSSTVGAGSSRPVDGIPATAPITGPVAGGGPTADSAQISNAARLAATLHQAIVAAPDTDAGRVAPVQRAIAEGRYQIDAQQIANRLLKLEADLQAAGADQSKSQP